MKTTIDEPLPRVRRICLALPEATEQEAWGEPTFRVRKKIFAMYASASNHHGGGRDALWCKAPLGVQEVVVRSDPDTYFSPPYVGVKGWIGIRLGSIGDAELREHVVESYCLVAPKKLRARLEGEFADTAASRGRRSPGAARARAGESGGAGS